VNQTTTARKPRIVFALVDSGMGHKSPALAVREHLEAVAPGRFDILIVDILAELGLKRLDTVIKRGWSDVLLRYPILINVIYWIFSAFSGLLVPVIAWLVTPEFILLDRYCRRMDADLVVTTHFLSINPFAMLRQRGRVEIPVVGMVVDPFETYRVVAHPGLDSLVTFSRRSFDVYRRHLPSVDVQRFGFPLSARYAERSQSRLEARRALDIPPSRFVLLMTAGAEGVGNFQQFFQAVVATSLDIHVMVVCGRNKALRHELEEWAGEAGRSGASRTECTIFGFVDTMDELITACDVFLGAGGANLTFEALAIGRPMILTLYTPNIRGTIDYVVRNGFGWSCTREKEFVSVIRRLAADSSLLQEAEQRIAAARIRSGTPELSAYLAGLIGEEIPRRTAKPGTE
jgi:1,2-diacylglycerol 3-beta-galactosyltransferase